MQTFELGADSKRLLIDIRDRLPATTSPAPGDAQPWEIFGPREQAILQAWVSPDNQVAWVERGKQPAAKGYRRLYVGSAS